MTTTRPPDPRAGARPYPDTSAYEPLLTEAQKQRFMRAIYVAAASMAVIMGSPSLWFVPVAAIGFVVIANSVEAFFEWALAGTCRQDEYDERAMRWFKEAELPPYDYTDTVELLASELEPEPERPLCLHENTEIFSFGDTRGTQTVCVDCGATDYPSPPAEDDISRMRRELETLEAAIDQLKRPFRGARKC